MYTIDLLKSNGLPVRNNIRNAIAIGFLFSVPIVIFVMITASYAQSRMMENNDKQTLEYYQKRFGNLKSHITTEDLIIQRHDILNKSLNEVKDVLDNNVQWTPNLATIEKLLPPTLTISRLEVKTKTFQRPVPKREDPKVLINITEYKRILTLYLQSSSRFNPDSVVAAFKDELTNSPLLMSRIRDITISSRRPETIDGVDVMSYEMNCTFGGEI